MSVWALADLHLAFGVPEKKMDVFGPEWINYSEKIKENWLASIVPEDLVLIPGDISWAKTLEEARVDLEWIDSLPGTKILIKGNHDYWWGSLSKVQQALPKSIQVIQNNAIRFGSFSVGGARLWDTDEYAFNPYIEMRTSPVLSRQDEKPDQEKIFKRELERLELSLKALDQKADARIVMTHYPPISADLQPSKASALLEKYRVNICVFGHLHSVKKNMELFGVKNGVRYALTSCDWLDFKPLKII